MVKLEPAIEDLRQRTGCDQVHRLPFGKVMLKAPGSSKVIKAATSPRGRALLKNEAKGISALAGPLSQRLRVPEVSTLHDDDQLCALEFTVVDGTTPSSWRAPKTILEPLFHPQQTTKTLSELLEFERLDHELKNTLLTRHGDPQIPVAPSHGDYIYWNLLCQSGREPGLIDFEYYHPCRLSVYDDLHFQAAPWLWRTLRTGAPDASLKPILRFFVKRQTADLNPELIFDLFLVHWTQIAEWIYTSDVAAGDRSNFPRLRVGPKLLAR